MAVVALALAVAIGACTVVIYHDQAFPSNSERWIRKTDVAWIIGSVESTARRQQRKANKH